MAKVRVAAFSISLDGFGAGIHLPQLDFQVEQSTAGEGTTRFILRR